jgi:flagellin-like hook-associated protein FlgL
LDGNAGFVSGETFSYGYNWDWMENSDSALLTGKYLAGRYTVTSSDSLQSLINKVNDGTQSRVGVMLNGSALASHVNSGGTLAICLGDEAYVFGSARVAGATVVIPASAGQSGYMVTGSFTGTDFYANSAFNFGLNSAQRDALSAAGINLGALGFGNNISVEASASALSLSSARDLLTQRLNEAWNNLGINGYRAISLNAGSDSPGTSANAAITVDNILNSAGNSLTNITDAGMVRAGQTLTVHTGIYSDGSGNWTTETAIASALGLEELVYKFTNNNTSSNTFRAYIDYTSASHFAGQDYGMSAVTRTSIINANVNLAGFNLSSANIHASAGSNTNSASAKATVTNMAKGMWNNLFLGKTKINMSAGAFANTRIDQNNFFASGGITTTVTSGQIFKAHTGLYLDNAGNYTFNTSVAQALGMGEAVFEIERVSNSAPFSASLYIGGVKSSYNLTNLNSLGSNNNAGWIFLYAMDDLRGQITSFANAAGSTGNGEIVTSAYTSANIPANTTVTYDDTLPLLQAHYEQNSPLSVTLNGAALTTAMFTTTPAQTNTRVSLTGGPNNDFIEMINTSLNEVIGARQGASSAVHGRLYSINASIPAGPTLATIVTNTPSIITMGASPEIVLSGDGIVDASKALTIVATNSTSAEDASGVSNFGAVALARAINGNSSSQFWAMVQSVNSNGQSADMVYVFTKQGGNYNDLLACEVADSDNHSRSALGTVAFENLSSSEFNESGTNFSLGGEFWAKMKPTQTKANLGNEVWNITIEGRDVGAERDIWIANAGDITTPNLNYGIINGMDRNSFVEIQNAANSPWAGGEVRTQSAAQAALDAITESINTKDKIRADLGALQNRLENTMTNLTVQAENLQASESRISDVDVATEMTEFTRNNVLAQAATSMLAQANSLSQLALSLIG